MEDGGEHEKLQGAICYLCRIQEEESHPIERNYSNRDGRICSLQLRPSEFGLTGASRKARILLNYLEAVLGKRLPHLSVSLL